MSSIWGNHLRISVFGESHGPAVGVVIDGLPPGLRIDWEAVRAQMARRAPGRHPWSTPRQETDAFEIMSGVFGEHTTGTPLAARIASSDQHPSSYTRAERLPRPGHADFTGHIRYRGFEDYRGGGHFSGRLTAPLVFAGAIARQMLAERGVAIGSHIARIGLVVDEPWGARGPDAAALAALAAMDFPVNSPRSGKQMIDAICAARDQGDSLGGVIETALTGVPAGIGSPLFEAVESRAASLLFSIPAVKGVSFGAGFDIALMPGSLANDPFVARKGRVETATNHNGGVLGGITTGMPIRFQVAVKPTPSIARPQATVDPVSLEPREIAVTGRHDACIVPRAVPAVEAAAALALADIWMGQPGWEADR